MNQKDTLSCQNIPNNHNTFWVPLQSFWTFTTAACCKSHEGSTKRHQNPSFGSSLFRSIPSLAISSASEDMKVISFFSFLCLFPYLHNGDKTSPSPMDNYQIKSPVYEMLQSETSRTIVEPWGATTLSRQQHLWTKKKNLSLLQRNKANILHCCIFRKINTQYLNSELPPHDKNPCQVSFLQHNEIIVLLRPQST